MNFDWRNIDLKNASIFDLTDDMELIEECVGGACFNAEEKDEYLKNLDDMERYLSMNEFSDRIDDVELEQAIDKTFPEEKERWKAIFNE